MDSDVQAACCARWVAASTGPPTGLVRLSAMSRAIVFEIDVPDTLEQLRLPAAVDERLTHLLDVQDEDGALTPEERSEAEGLADLAELLSLLRVRAERLSSSVH